MKIKSMNKISKNQKKKMIPSKMIIKTKKTKKINNKKQKKD